MIKIALCDDDSVALAELDALLSQYRLERGADIQWTPFSDPLPLLNAIRRGVRFDILLLDILMPHTDGIDTAAEIRRYDRSAKIIFLTSSPEFAVQSYTVDAFFYLLKPIVREDFFRLMDSALAECEKERESSLLLRCKNGITRVRLSQIEYCEVIHRTLFIHLTSGKVLESMGSLDDLSRGLLQGGCFLRPHRSYLVNLEHVQSLSYHAITMTYLADIPIPRGKYHEVKDAYLEYAFTSGQVIR